MSAPDIERQPLAELHASGRPGWLRSMQLVRYLGVSHSHWKSHILPTLREANVSTLPISPSSRAWSVAEAEEALRQKFGTGGAAEKKAPGDHSPRA